MKLKRHIYKLTVLILCILQLLTIGCEDKSALASRTNSSQLNSSLSQLEMAIASQNLNELDAALRSLNSLKKLSRSQKETVALACLSAHDLTAQITLQSISNQKNSLFEKLKTTDYLSKESKKTNILFIAEEKSEKFLSADQLAIQNDFTQEKLEYSLAQLEDLEDYRDELLDSIEDKTEKISSLLTEAKNKEESLQDTEYKDSPIEFNKIHELRLEAELLKNKQDQEDVELKMNVELDANRIELIVEGKEKELSAVQNAFNKMDAIKKEHNEIKSNYLTLTNSIKNQIQTLIRESDDIWPSIDTALVKAKESISKAIEKSELIRGDTGSLNQMRLRLTAASISFERGLIHELRAQAYQSINDKESASMALEIYASENKEAKEQINKIQDISENTELNDQLDYIIKLMNNEISFFNNLEKNVEISEESIIEIINKYNKLITTIKESDMPFKKVNEVLDLFYFASEEEKIMTYSGIGQMNQMLQNLPKEMLDTLVIKIKPVLDNLFPTLTSNSIKKENGTIEISSSEGSPIKLIVVDDSLKIDSRSFSSTQKKGQEELGKLFQELMQNPF